MSLLPLLSGCRAIVDVAAGAFGPAAAGGAVDAHVVYHLRPDCPTLLARTLDNGYTVLSPREGLPAAGGPAVAVADIEETGVLEGPVSEGEVVFRYIPPTASETWDAGPLHVVADVAAVRLTQAEGSAALLAACGPLPADSTSRPPSP